MEEEQEREGVRRTVLFAKFAKMCVGPGRVWG